MKIIEGIRQQDNKLTTTCQFLRVTVNYTVQSFGSGQGDTCFHIYFLAFIVLQNFLVEKIKNIIVLVSWQRSKEIVHNHEVLQE